jgi:hypothetical protein
MPNGIKPIRDLLVAAMLIFTAASCIGGLVEGWLAPLIVLAQDVLTSPPVNPKYKTAGPTNEDVRR